VVEISQLVKSPDSRLYTRLYFLSISPERNFRPGESKTHWSVKRIRKNDKRELGNAREQQAGWAGRKARARKEGSNFRKKKPVL
jgi:hypothetical protein